MALTQKQIEGFKTLSAKGYTGDQINAMMVDYANRTGQQDKLANVIQSGKETVALNKAQNTVDNPVKQVLNNVNNVNGGNTQTQNVEPVKSDITTMATTVPTQTVKNDVNTPTQVVETPKNVNNKAETASNFGYSTTTEQREARNQTIAQGLSNSDKFDYNQVYNYIKNQAPGVTDEDIKFTVQDIQNKYNTLQTAKADVKYMNDKKNQYQTLTSDQILTTNPSQKDLDILKQTDPNKFAEVMKKKSDNSILNMLNGNKEETPTLDTSTIISSLTVPTLGLVQLKNDLYNTTEMNSAQADVATKTKELNDLKDTMDGILDETFKQFEGSGADDTFIRATAQKRLDALQKQYKQKYNEYELANTTYTNLKSTADDTYKATVDQYNLDRQAYEDKLNTFKLAYGIQQDQQQRQDEWDKLYLNQQFQKEATQQAFDLKYGNIDSADPRAQKLAVDNAVQDIMDQYKGWTLKRSKAEIAGDVYKLVQDGKSLSEALSENVTSQLNANPQFREWVQKSNGNKQDDYTLKEVNGELYSIDIKNNKVTKLVGKDLGTANNASKVEDGTIGGQCGKFVNDSLGTKVFGDSIEQKKNMINSSTPTVGSVVIMDSKLNPANGHVGIVQSVNPDGTITIKDSNWGGDEKVQTHNIQANSKDIKGYYINPNADKQLMEKQVMGLVQGLGGTVDERKALADNILKTAIEDGTSIQEAKKKLGYKTKDDIEFADTRKKEYSTIKKETRDNLSQASTTLTLLDMPSTAISDVAVTVGFLKTIDPSSVARESEVASVENARGILDGLSAVFGKAKEGTKLSNEQRVQLKNAINTIVEAGKNKYYQYINDTVSEFNERGLDPTVYIPKSEINKATPPKQTAQQPAIFTNILDFISGKKTPSSSKVNNFVDGLAEYIEKKRSAVAK